MPSVAKVFAAALEHHQQGRLADAQTLYLQLLQYQPNHADALHLLGVIACQQNRFEEGADFVSRAIDVTPNVANFYNTLGNARRGLNDLSAAIAAYETAVVLDSTNLQAVNNLGVVLDEANRPGDALIYLDRLIAADDRVPQWHTNRGSVQMNAGHADAAIASYRRAIELQPNFALAHAKLSLALLQAGDFTAGWAEAEWRFDPSMPTPPLTPASSPRWTGQPLDGKTILVLTEQGFGDTIQFCRYAKPLADRGATVLLQCPPPLRRLLSSVAGISQLLDPADPLPVHDYHVPLLSVPMVFRTDLSNVPPPATISGAGLSAQTPRVGLAWAGNPANPNDRRRSCPDAFLPFLTDLPGVEFYSLQVPSRPPPPGCPRWFDLTADCHDFADTAELISRLDLVVTVDTAVAHLAGSMGKPTWILLPFAPEWRWLRDRSDSPWYPTARLFRQKSPGDWAGLLQTVRNELENRVRTDAVPPPVRNRKDCWP